MLSADGAIDIEMVGGDLMTQLLQYRPAERIVLPCPSSGNLTRCVRND